MPYGKMVHDREMTNTNFVEEKINKRVLVTYPKKS